LLTLHDTELTPRARRILDCVDLERGLVPLSIYNNPDVYQLELRRVFARSWVFLAHETEIPNPGDYVLRYIGEDPFIVVRDYAGQVHALFDSCRHRGTQLCRADRGNAAEFRCPYHGWTYRNDGQLTAVPNKDAAYPGMDETDWGLLQVPHLATYRGLIFASADPNAPSLDEHLGDFKWYLDLNLGLDEEGMEVLGQPHRWRISADWKSGSENFCGDGYHIQTLHRSLLETGLASPGPPGESQHAHITGCNGHAMAIRRTNLESTFFWGYPKDLVDGFTGPDLTRAQLEVAKHSMIHTGLVFPNLGFLHAISTNDPKRQPISLLVMFQFQPKGPGAIEAWSWTLVPKRASQSHKERAYQVVVATHSPAGAFEQDDVVVWEAIARPARSVFAETAGVQLNFQMGLQSVSQAKPILDWPGPGIAYDTYLEEGIQRTFLQRWLLEVSRPA